MQFARFIKGLGPNLRDLFQVHTINLSVAVWVGFIALFGIATDDGVFNILANFDLSVHQLAETLDGFTVMGPRYTYPTEAIEVLGYWTPNRTLARYRKLCARYGLEVDLREVKGLEDKIESSVSTL